MREAAFIKQNKDKWLEYEQNILKKSRTSPQKLADCYIELVNDLSYSQTYYPKSKTTVYLNDLASQTYQKIYKTKPLEQNRVIHFFTMEVPTLLYTYRGYLVFAFCVFLIFIAIGAVSTHYDVGFLNLILGDQYVDTTLENIKKGDSMAIYKSGENFSNFVFITANNLYVGLKMFIFGLFGGVGTLIYTMFNGIMLGSFQYFFIQHNEFISSFKGIWLHGTLEISALIIEAGAGMILGGSILFPKTYSRLESFKIGFKAAFKILLTTIPLTIVAGFIEGYLSRYAKELPDVLNYLIIALSAGLILFYYVIYPHLLHKTIKSKNPHDVRIV